MEIIPSLRYPEIKKLSVLNLILLMSALSLYAASNYEVSKGSECCAPVNGIFPGSDIEKKFGAANALYDRGDYRGAAAAYECLSGECGINNFSVYYNLGNSYYRLGEIGKAVLNYERAARLKPGDEDVKFNLSFIRASIKDAQPGGFLRAVYSVLSAGELAAVFCAINIVFFALLGFYVRFRKTRLGNLINRLAVWAGVLLVITGVWMRFRISDSGQIYAVVVGGQCEVRSGPRSDYASGLSIPEGKKVIILGEDGDWYAVGLPLEKYKGWVEKNKVEKI